MLFVIRSEFWGGRDGGWSWDTDWTRWNTAQGLYIWLWSSLQESHKIVYFINFCLTVTVKTSKILLKEIPVSATSSLYMKFCFTFCLYKKYWRGKTLTLPNPSSHFVLLKNLVIFEGAWYFQAVLVSFGIRLLSNFSSSCLLLFCKFDCSLHRCWTQWFCIYVLSIPSTTTVLMSILMKMRCPIDVGSCTVGAHHLLQKLPRKIVCCY